MISRSISHYRIIGKLGAGGMGEVYRAEDTSLGRQVAIKILPPRFADDSERLHRFAVEARAASSLNHPNIVTILEVGETDGCPYIVMEYVEGETLRELMRAGRLTTKRILEIAAQIAEGLSKAHAAGIVHRDLKPDNVMLTTDGFVKILDFGLAKLVDLPATSQLTAAEDAETGQSVWTSHGAVLGTVGYMSPEQAAGRAADFRADQFSLGAILYEMATGRRAFRRDTVAQTLAAIIEEDATPVGEMNPLFPAPCRWIIERCLAKEPGDRYASTLDLARELRGLREHAGEASISGRKDEVPDPRRRRRWALIALAALALILMAAGSYLLEKLHLIPLPAEKRLAVLPVRNPGGTADEQAACDGLHSYVVARLAELERFQDALWVVPAVEVRRAGGGSDFDVGRALGATLALEITVQRVGSGTLMSASLFDAARSRVLRAATRRIDAEASLLDQAVDAAVGMIDIELGEEERKTLAAGATNVSGASTLYAQALAHQPYEQARSALERYEQRKSLEQAVTLFNAALERDPRYALAHAGLGEAYLRLWQLTREAEYVTLAEEHSRRAIEMDPLVGVSWLTLGSLHAQTGKPDEALADFHRAQARAPRKAEVFRERALALDRLQRFDEAERDFREAIQLRPDAWSTLNSYALFLRRRARLKEAETTLRQALERAPDNARLWSNLGAVLLNAERYGDAEAALRKSISIQPTAAAISNLATREFFAGRYAEAARSFEAAAKLSPLDYRLQNNLASAYLFQPGERARAIEAYKRTLALAEREHQLDPKDALPLASMAECLVQIGDHPKARGLIAEALRLGPLSWFLASRAASVYEDLGDRESALRWLDAAFRAGYSRAEAERSPTFRRLREDPRYAKISPLNSNELGNKKP